MIRTNTTGYYACYSAQHIVARDATNVTGHYLNNQRPPNSNSGVPVNINSGVPVNINTYPFLYTRAKRDELTKLSHLTSDLKNGKYLPSVLCTATLTHPALHLLLRQRICIVLATTTGMKMPTPSSRFVADVWCLEQISS